MKVDLICIGSELLTGLAENTNAGYLSRRLWSSGIPVREQVVVPDEIEVIISSLKRALEYSEVVICTGGLGPTGDDLTRDAVARLLELPLQLDRGWLAKLEGFFAARGCPMPEANRKQAMVIEGSLLLDNPRGTAPGAIVKEGARTIVLLPGPPQELQPMFEEKVLPFLKKELSGGEIWLSKTIKCIGLGESLLEEKIKQAGAGEYPALSLAACGLEVHLQLKARGHPGAAESILRETAGRLRLALGEYIYGQDDDTLAGVVAARLSRLGLTLALAESCSGGLLADMITDVPGSSLFFKGSMVAYSTEAKINLLGIDPQLLEREGAVSEAVALALARAAGKVLSADAGIGITGIAGPESDSSGRSVGLVYVAVVFGDRINCIQLNLAGTRRAVKERAAQAALAMLWRMMPADAED